MALRIWRGRRRREAPVGMRHMREIAVAEQDGTIERGCYDVIWVEWRT